MIDPISAFAIASTAYSSIKKVIGHAQDLESISKQLGSWYGACSDINRAEQQRKNPTFFERATQGQSIEEEALQILIHKKTLKEREIEIKTLGVDRPTIEKVDDIWIPKQMTMRSLRRGTYTRMNIEKMEPNVDLETNTFEIRRLIGH